LPCPPSLEHDPENMDYSFYGYFRPVLGEMGDFDPGMLVEFEKGYKVIYYACEHNTCTYEMDETPPFPPDPDAILKGFTLAHYFNCSALAEEIPVVLVVEPLFGYIHLRVYETGRDMLARGVIEGGNMLPSAAYTKLIWVLGHTRNMDEVKQLMQTNIAGEITQREGPRGFLLLQGIEPGVKAILRNL